MPKMLILGLLAKKSDLGNLIAKMIDFRWLSPKWLILRLLAKKVIQAIVAKNWCDLGDCRQNWLFEGF